MAMIEAEEDGVTQANVDEMLKSPRPDVQRLLGVSGGFGKMLGVDDRWADNVIKQGGNYGASSDPNVGKGGPPKLRRAPDRLRARRGPMYAVPLRRNYQP